MQSEGALFCGLTERKPERCFAGSLFEPEILGTALALALAQALCSGTFG